MKTSPLKPFTGFVIFAFFLLQAQYSAAQDYVWSKRIGTTNNPNAINSEAGRAVATDNDGNVYSMGVFYGNMGLGPGIQFTADSTALSTYIIKYDPSGNILWAKQFGHTNANKVEGLDVEVDKWGNVYMTGLFNGTPDFDPGPGVYNLTSYSSDLFVCKLNTNGGFIWAKNLAGTSSEAGRAVCPDTLGNVYVTGGFHGTVDFDPSASGTFSLTAPAFGTVFALKLDSAGNFIWARKIENNPSTSFSSSCSDMALDPATNRIYICGTFTGRGDFDPNAGTFELVDGGGRDAFIWQLDHLGQFGWAKKYGNDDFDYGYGVAVDDHSNVYFTYEVENYPASPAAYISKHTVSGTVLWTKSLQNGSSHGLSIATDHWGNSYTTGYFSGVCNFDASIVLDAEGSHNTFLLKLDSLGAFVSARHIRGGGPSYHTNRGHHVAIDNTNNIHITGRFAYTADFDPGIDSVKINSVGNTLDGYLLRLCSKPPRTSAISGPTVLCQNTTATYSVEPLPLVTSYTWVLPNGWTGTGTTNSIQVTTGTAGGTIQVYANNACGSSVANSINVTINNVPAQPVTVSGPGSVCAGSSAAYSVNPVAGALSYTWTLPGGWGGSSATADLTATAGGTGGTIGVTADNACGASTPAILAVSVVDTLLAATANIQGPDSVCAGTANTYQVAAQPGATSYTWVLPSGWSGSSATNGITLTAGTQSGNLTVSAGNACATGAAATLPITVHTIPATPGIPSGADTLCANTPQAYGVATVPGATSYIWTLPNGWTGQSTTGTIATVSGSAGGTITVSADNFCGSSAPAGLPVYILPVPGSPTAILGANTLCAGAAHTYQTPPVAGASSYTWSLPLGWAGTPAGNGITVSAGSAGGQLAVTAGNMCGESLPFGVDISVTDTVLPAAGTITGPVEICAGTAVTYTIPPVPGADSYLWQLPTGWTGTPTSNSLSANAGENGGTIRVRAQNACASGDESILAVTVNPLPQVSMPALGTVCVGTAPFMLSGAQPAGGTYGGTGVNAGQFSPSVAGMGTFTLTYTYTDADGCQNTADAAIIVSSCAGIGESETDHIIVYPVPTERYIQISGLGGKRAYSITNMAGQTVQTGMVGENGQIDLEPFPAGIYQLKVGDLYRKIIKTRSGQ